MTLKEAVIRVVEQNESLNYHPEIFIFQTKRGEAKDLSWRVSNFIKSESAIESVMAAIEEYGDILSIEDLIIKEEDGFGLPQEVISKARQSAEAFEWRRNS